MCIRDSLFTLYREHQRVRKHHSKAFFRSGTLYPSRKESIQICEIYRGKKGPYYMDKWLGKRHYRMGYGTACEPGACLPSMWSHHQRESLGLHRASRQIMLFRSSYSGRNRQEFPFRKSDEIGKDRRLGPVIIVLFTSGKIPEVTIFRGLLRNPDKPEELHRYRNPAKKPIDWRPVSYTHLFWPDGNTRRWIGLPQVLIHEY